jgi:hypothetical protein
VKTTYSAFGMHVPQDTLETLNRYIEHGIPTGGFLEAVINNDLYCAVARADDNNIRALPAIVSYLYNEAPSSCWGRANAFEKWIERAALEREKAAI